MTNRRKSVRKPVKAASFPTVTVKAKGAARGSEVEITLDGDVEDQLDEAFGDDLKRLKLEIVGVEDFNEEALKELGREVAPSDLITLGEMVEDQSHDPDVVAAALLVADGDVADAKRYLDEGLAWVGGRNEDESDYAAHVVEEGLMGDKLGDYFDYEAFGRDLAIEAEYAIEHDGQYIVFSGR